MKLGPVQFLLPDRGVRDGDSIILLQSGAPWRLVQLLDLLLLKYPKSRVSVLLRPEAQPEVPARPGVEIIVNEGSKAALVRRLRARRFDRAFLLATNEPGFIKMKALAFVLGPAAICAVNESLDWFEIDLRHTKVVAQHLRARLDSSITFAGEARSPFLEKVLKATVYPATLAYLLAFERTHQAAARLRGLGAWKRENRPGKPGRGGS